MDTLTALTERAESASYVTRAEGYVVVSRLETGYVYETRSDLDEARDTYKAIKDGQHPGFDAVGIFATVNGMPIGSALDIAAMDKVAPGCSDSPASRHQWAQFLLNHPDCASGIAWQRGQDARAAGKIRRSCPYIEGDEAEEWQRGWDGLASKWARWAARRA